MLSLPGDHVGCSSLSGPSAIRRTELPSGDITHIPPVPPRSLENAIHFPFGDQDGLQSFPFALVSLFSSPLTVSIRQRSMSLPDPDAKTTYRPSGEQSK